MDVLLDLWFKADARAFAAELRIRELERHCMCSQTMRLPPRPPVCQKCIPGHPALASEAEKARHPPGKKLTIKKKEPEPEPSKPL